MVEKKAYLHIGPKFGTVSKQAVTEAIKACRDKRDGDWLLILGFAFESGITELSRSFGNFQVSIVRMHDDLLQLGLLKKDKKAASFVTIGEPDIHLISPIRPSPGEGQWATVEIAGLDIYDPIKDEVKSRDVQDIAYWMLEDDRDTKSPPPFLPLCDGGFLVFNHVTVNRVHALGVTVPQIFSFDLFAAGDTHSVSHDWRAGECQHRVAQLNHRFVS